MESWSTCTSNCLNNESYIDQGLPPGFRFHPTDEELVSHYLAKKIENPNFACRAVVEADLNKSEPWELPGKAAMGEKEWYFYSARDRKYPTGMRTNRATEAGYWKATGKDREVVSSSGGRIVGMKKTLVFYRGRAPKGIKSNWVMHEYRHEGHLQRNNNVRPSATRASKDEWVVCRIFHKSPGGKKMGLSELRQSSSNVGVGVYSTSLPPLLDSPTPAASGSAGGRSEQETLMLNAFLHYSSNNIKSEPLHGDGAGSDAPFHDSAILAASAVAAQNGITNPMLFAATSRSQVVEPHQRTLQSSAAAAATLVTRGSHVSQGVPGSLNAIVSNTFTSHSNVGTASASNDQSYHHQQLSSMQYINPSPFIDPLLTNTSTAMAPLSRLPSDLDTYWLYSDRLQ